MLSVNSANSMRNLAVFFHSLGVNIVCEGIENSEQLNGCFEAGCYLYQGYCFYKPLLIKDVLDHYSDVNKTILKSYFFSISPTNPYSLLIFLILLTNDFLKYVNLFSYLLTIN
jgi:c-di-GMP-related signal transduction protein